MQEGGVEEDLLRRQHPEELLLVREALSPAVFQVGMHVLRDRVVGDAAVDEEWRKLLELGPQLLRNFDVHLCKPEPLARTQQGREDVHCSLGVGVSRDDSLTSRHLLHHGAGIERIGVIAEDALGWRRVLILVGANLGLARHVLAGEYKAWPTNDRCLQHVIRLFVGGV